MRDGLGAHPELDLRGLLGQGHEADDRTLALALVARVAAEERVRLAHGGSHPPPRMSLPVEVADSSFLGRLKVEASANEPSVASIEDVATLLLVMRAGSLRQRRAAAAEIAERLGSGNLAAEDMRRLESTIDGLRDVELGYELVVCRQRLASGRTREAQRQRRLHAELVARVTAEVPAYWDGELADEPLMKLSGDERTLLLLSARALDDGVLAHVGALIEGATGNVDRGAQRAIVSAVRYAGDTRLVPSLLSLLASGAEDLVVEVARAVSRIEDPRVQPALVAAYERSLVDAERIALGAALGRVGDVRAQQYVRAQLQHQDDHVLSRALEALRTVGTVDDIAQVLGFLHGEDTVLASKAAHTLGRIGDGRCLPALMKLAAASMVGSVRAAAEEAVDQIRARMLLRGEEPPSESFLPASEQRSRLTELRQPTFGVRVRGLRHVIVGRLLQMFGATRRALVRFELAAQARGDWAQPTLLAGMIHTARGEYAQALPLFRRALEADRAQVEQRPIVMQKVARCFLRRAEQVERDGRHAIARGLLDEVLSLDLRRVPSSLRFEIGRRHEALRKEGT